MTYEEALERIHGFSRFGSRLGLSRMERLLDRMGNPQEDMKVIHVAGTNGKGSVSRFLYSILLENGYKVGLYTSPFLERFTERIEFDGREISREDLATSAEAVLLQVDKMVSAGEDSPTEFELVTAIAFHYFSKKPMDLLILEVGLGGRGDSTNVIKTPLVSVITTISYDHMAQLGDTLEKIAFEKAGIVKPGCPVVCGAGEPGAQVIRQAAEERGSEFYAASLLRLDGVETSRRGSVFNVDSSIGKRRLEGLRISMLGAHQVGNARCALTVVELLRKQGIIRISDDKIRKGLENAFHPGRMEIIKEKPLILIDGAVSYTHLFGVGHGRHVCFGHVELVFAWTDPLEHGGFLVADVAEYHAAVV